ncbi:MAG: HNH endonuclease [Pseudoalteromonas sp.]|nr:HNH endonuclease [Pseudoalteromonas sp.]
MITQQQISEALFFNPNGEVRHNKPNTSHHNKIVGSRHHTGYLVHTFNKKQYGLHRLVFLHFHGYLPKSIDHFDQDKSNNAISNLVPSDATHNGMNRRLNKNNTSGVVGVVFDKRRDKWKAQIKVNGKQISIGSFTDKDKAITARKEAEHKYGFAKLHGAN